MQGDRMKKHAQLGQWKTPPNAVYAQQEPTQPSAATTASLGTKMQLMGLVQQKKTAPPPPPPMSAAPSMTLSSAPISFAVPPPPSHFTPMATMPSRSPIEPSAFMALTAEDSPGSSGEIGKKTALKRPSSNSSRKEAGLSTSPSGEKAKPPVTPEDKQKVLAHSRTMARLRRQQQRVLTDSLESEFFELCVSAAYLKAALTTPVSTGPLHSSQVEKIYQEATERSLEAMSSNIPAARSQELKAHAVSGKINMPQAHFVPSLKMDDAAAVYLAVTVGSRRESLSFSTERRKGALAWSTSGVKEVFSKLNEDALPVILATSCAMDDPNEQMLASRLRLTPDQKERLRQMVLPIKGDVMKVMANQKAQDILFSDSWLSLPKTDAFMEQFRDTTTTEQMSKLISWSITNETQISTLKLGSVPSSVSASPSSSSTVAQ